MAADVTVIDDLLEARVTAEPPGSGPIRIGLLVPLSGSLGLCGPSAVNCATLAASEINAAGGILGRPVELVLVDGGLPAPDVAAEVAGLAAEQVVEAVIGMHTSDVRLAVAGALRGRIPYVYTPPYEGGERSPGVFLVGETPESQLRPVLEWMVAHRRARRWLLLGNDYVWPRSAHRAAATYLREYGGRVVDELYVPLGGMDHPDRAQRLLDRIAATRPDAILLNLVGDDLVEFNRLFAAAGPRGSVLRLCGALEENGLLGIDGDGSGELYASMGYFGSLATDAGLSFLERYVHRFGAEAPVLGGHGQSTYEGVRLLEALAARSGSLSAPEMAASSDGTAVTGARGRLVMRDRHLRQPTYLARADGLEFDVLTSF